MKKCKCSFETQTRAANPHIPSSDKNQKVSINARWDREKIKQDTRPNAQKWNVGPEPRKGLGTSRADVSGNARHFCEVEFNFEDVSPNSTTRIREKALRNESLETNNAKDCLQSCGYLSKWTSFLPFLVQLLGYETEFNFKDVRPP